MNTIAVVSGRNSSSKATIDNERSPSKHDQLQNGNNNDDDMDLNLEEKQINNETRHVTTENDNVVSTTMIEPYPSSSPSSSSAVAVTASPYAVNESSLMDFHQDDDEVATMNDEAKSSISLENDNNADISDSETQKTVQAKQRKKFFNRVARVSTMLLRREKDARLLKDGHNVTDIEDDSDEEEDNVVVDDEVTAQSDLTRPGRYIHIVTTASLPWFTGTAVNPLLRAAYLHERLEQINQDANVTHAQGKSSWVTLVIPWLELPEDQQKIYHGQVFESPKEQETYVRNWLRDQAGMPDAADNLNLVFYPARYHEDLGSVFAMGDIIQQLPQDELDVCVLEEPEQ
jgi:hypothetical protein